MHYASSLLFNICVQHRTTLMCVYRYVICLNKPGAYLSVCVPRVIGTLSDTLSASLSGVRYNRHSRAPLHCVNIIEINHRTIADYCNNIAAIPRIKRSCFDL